ncbi:membrane protease subunit HflC [Novosphingobium kunmingense]|uniref:Membrane protease subunit HflC n=1 Tax=Novosphingobium kunmingense TaxID=1211806 RepID=A0A2N0HK73_9SPHN|nr:SPFH domain-containing protein [Novosphingobium kunmingense]PKB19350.1 membrane protease subunit HflC [Novosphingobium kunmingense]
MANSRTRAALFVFGTAAILLGLSVSAVPEGRQAVVTRMGEPVRVVNRWTPVAGTGGGGLILHLPLVERVEWVERGLFGTTAERLPVTGSDKAPLLVDASATLRAFDPVKVVANGGGADKAVAQVNDALRAIAQQELGQVPSGQLLQPGTGGATQRLRAALDARARPLGLQVVDLRLTGAVFPEGELQQTIERMEGERARIAAAETENGAREAERILMAARTDSARMLGSVAGRDPAFYDFFRAIQSYEVVFGGTDRKNKATIILGPDSEYLKQFRGQ